MVYRIRERERERIRDGVLTKTQYTCPIYVILSPSLLCYKYNFQIRDTPRRYIFFDGLIKHCKYTSVGIYFF